MTYHCPLYDIEVSQGPKVTLSKKLGVLSFLGRLTCRIDAIGGVLVATDIRGPLGLPVGSIVEPIAVKLAAPYAKWFTLERSAGGLAFSLPWAEFESFSVDAAGDVTCALG